MTARSLRKLPAFVRAKRYLERPLADAAIAQLVGVHRHTIRRWRRQLGMVVGRRGQVSPPPSEVTTLNSLARSCDALSERSRTWLVHRLLDRLREE